MIDSTKGKIKTVDYIVLGLSLVLFALWAYMTLNGKNSGFDSVVQYFVISCRYPVLNSIGIALEYVGHWPLPTIVGLAFVIPKKTRFSYGFPLACSVLTSIGLYEMFKYIFKRVRPDQSLWLCNEHGYSFPSGHTLNNTVFWMTLASLLTYYFLTKGKKLPLYKKDHSTQLYPKSKGMMVFLRIILILWPLTIGISRILVGVHWPSDVVASLILAVFVLEAEKLILFKEN